MLFITAGRRGHTDKAVPEHGRCSCSVKQHSAFCFPGCLVCVPKTHCSSFPPASLSTEGTFLCFFQGKLMPGTPFCFLRFLPSVCLLPPAHRKISTKIARKAHFSCCLLLGHMQGSAVAAGISSGMINSAPSTDIQSLDKLLHESDIFKKK